jgi:exonuclease VII small subunit
MTDKKPSFDERIDRLQQLAHRLANAATILEEEVEAMRGARARYEKRSATRDKAHD